MRNTQAQAGRFNRFATELSLDRFKQRYDAGEIGAYAAPGESIADRRRTAAGMRGAVTVHESSLQESSSSSPASRNDMWPTASELAEVAERLEAYVRKLDGHPAAASERADVHLGRNYKFTGKQHAGEGASRANTSCWAMPLPQLRMRIGQQRGLVTKWEHRLAQAQLEDAGKTGPKPRMLRAKKRLRETQEKLLAAEAILAERERERERENK